jgi:uncharacterized protein YjbI with pentapeptide repeats
MNKIALLAAPILALGLALAGPALAQNAGQIAKARAGANCPGCNLFQADFGGAELKNKNFAKARLRQADLSIGVYNGTIFAGGDLRDINAYGAVFSSANFAGADLTNANFVGAYLQGSNFAGANLTGANFSGAEMQRTVGLRQAQLSKACGDSSTRLPPGLTVEECR